MIPSTFNFGNYNNWDKFVRETLPNSLILIEQTIIPQIDTILSSMLGNNSKIIKESINVTQNCSEILNGITLDILYIVEDFKVPDAPDKAVAMDTESIKNAIVDIGNFILNSIKIDTTQGYLNLQFIIPFEA